MQSKFASALLLIACASVSSASTEEERWISRCGGPFQLCGYVELKSQAERIPQRFEVAKDFSEGLAAVRIDGLYGYIDRTGQVVIPPQFPAAGPFTGGYAEVRVDGLSGAIDRSGKLVVPAQFRRLIPFADGTFIASPHRPDSPPDTSEPRLEGLSLLSLISGPGSAGLYHIRKGWLTPTDLQFRFFDEPARGLIWAGKRNEHHHEEWGLMRADGTWQVTPRYAHVQGISETHAVVAAMPDYSLTPLERLKTVQLRGAVDRDGKLVVPMEARGLSYWRGGYGYAHEAPPPTPNGPGAKGRKGIVQSDGSLLGGRWFDEVDIRQDGKLPRGRIGHSWYSIERDGRLVADQLEGTAFIKCDNGLTFVHRGDLVEVHRPGDGKATGKFEKGILRQVDCPGPFSGSRNGKYFKILEHGTVLGEPNGFDDSYGFSGQYAAVKVGGKWGIIDRSGAFTVKPQFRKLRPGARDKFVVGEGKKVAWMDGRGAWIKAPPFKRPDPKEALTCPGGLRFFSAEGLWGLQDGDGKTVIEPRYRALSCFREGVTWTAAPGDDGWCAVGPDGRRREAMKCRKRYYPVTVTHHFPEKFSDDAYESSVLWTRAWLESLAGVRKEPPKWLYDGEGPGSYSVMPGVPTDR